MADLLREDAFEAWTNLAAQTRFSGLPRPIYNQEWISVTESLGDVTIPTNGQVSSKYFRKGFRTDVVPLQGYVIRAH
jgi:hypothetical protein